MYPCHCDVMSTLAYPPVFIYAPTLAYNQGYTVHVYAMVAIPSLKPIKHKHKLIKQNEWNMHKIRV